MPIFGEIFISEILKRPVLDLKGEEIGSLRDLIVVRGQRLPVVDSLVVSRKRNLYRIPWESMSMFNRRIIATTLTKDSTPLYEETEDDLLAVRDILDKQIVDVTGVKVVRVNDIKLEGFEGLAVLVAIDVGMRGLLRRLGFEKQAIEILRLLKVELPYNLISWNYLQPLEPKLKKISLTVPRQMVSQIHPADIAELISTLSIQEGRSLLQDLDIETAAETLSELNLDVQADLIESMDPEKAFGIISQMEPDEAADLLAGLPQEKMRLFLEMLEPEIAEDIQRLLEHEEDTAGGLMTSDFIAYTEETTVREAMERFKKDAEDIETVYYIYVVDQCQRLQGVLSLRELLLAEPDAQLKDIMVTDLKTVPPDVDESVVAAAISKYDLVAIPVVDNEGVLLGIVTVDDIIDRILPPRARRKQKKV
jgi:CBS domain-containing protein/sporulation protein YlmC with PRC-barrel domain